MNEVPVRTDDLRALAGMFGPAIGADPYPVYARWLEHLWLAQAPSVAGAGPR